MRGILRRFLESPALWFMTLFLCIWIGARFWHEAATEGFTVLRIVKAGLVTVRALLPDRDE